MSFSEDVLQNDEKAIYSLRELYRNHGYSHYKVSKFEEYDLYAYNKNFLISENILSFTDTNGKLMALKPDVTLSIAKNMAPGDNSVHKLYYNEYVYRTSSEGDGFHEIMQTGLECIGRVDLFSECEVIMLAAKSLATIGRDYLLDISHMGLIEGMIEEARIAPECSSEFIKLVSAKNVPGLRDFCSANKIEAEMTENICRLVGMYLPIKSALAELKRVVLGDKMARAYCELEKIAAAMELYGLADKLYIDLSVINDMSYYDGVIFNGFIKDIPDSVLSGGRYDRLLQKLGKSVDAIGFAVYLDRLEQLKNNVNEYDVDVILIYDESVDIKDLINAVESLNRENKTVLTATMVDENIRCRQILTIEKGGIRKIENND